MSALKDSKPVPTIEGWGRAAVQPYGFGDAVTVTGCKKWGEPDPLLTRFIKVDSEDGYWIEGTAGYEALCVEASQVTLTRVPGVAAAFAAPYGGPANNPEPNTNYAVYLASGEASKLETAILQLVGDYGQVWTRREIANSLSIEASTISGAVNRLIKKGALEHSQTKQQCLITGNTVWAVLRKE